MSELIRAIEAEPDLIAGALTLELGSAVERLASSKRLWLVGTGTSQHAAELGTWMFGPGERLVQWRSSAGFAWQDAVGLRRDDGVIVISHTGETALARRARAAALTTGAAVVAVTAQGSSWPEAVQAAPRERSETYTGSYLAALVVLARLSLALGQSTVEDRSLALLPAAVRGALAQGASLHVDLDLTGTRSIAVIGAGPGAITAREGALKLREAARLLAEGYEAEYLLHGNAVPLDARDTLIALAPSHDAFGLIDRLVTAARAEGVTTGVIEAAPDGLGPVLAQIPLTVRLQLLAALTAEARGVDPDTVIVGGWADPGLWEAGAPE